MEHLELHKEYNTKPAQEVIDMLMSDPDYSGYKLSLKDGGDVNFIVWENPDENERWLDSGYGEDYEDGEDASMPVLAINDKGEIFKLAPEEKCSYSYSSEYGKSGNIYNETGDIYYPMIKSEFEDSVWEYQG